MPLRFDSRLFLLSLWPFSSKSEPVVEHVYVPLTTRIDGVYFTYWLILILVLCIFVHLATVLWCAAKYDCPVNKGFIDTFELPKIYWSKASTSWFVWSVFMLFVMAILMNFYVFADVKFLFDMYVSFDQFDVYGNYQNARLTYSSGGYSYVEATLGKHYFHLIESMLAMTVLGIILGYGINMYSFQSYHQNCINPQDYISLYNLYSALNFNVFIVTLIIVFIILIVVYNLVEQRGKLQMVVLVSLLICIIVLNLDFLNTWILNLDLMYRTNTYKSIGLSYFKLSSLYDWTDFLEWMSDIISQTLSLIFVGCISIIFDHFFKSESDVVQNVGNLINAFELNLLFVIVIFVSSYISYLITKNYFSSRKEMIITIFIALLFLVLNLAIFYIYCIFDISLFSNLYVSFDCYISTAPMFIASSRIKNTYDDDDFIDEDEEVDEWMYKSSSDDEYTIENKYQPKNVYNREKQIKFLEVRERNEERKKLLSKKVNVELVAYSVMVLVVILIIFLNIKFFLFKNTSHAFFLWFFNSYTNHIDLVKSEFVRSHKKMLSVVRLAYPKWEAKGRIKILKQIHKIEVSILDVSKFNIFMKIVFVYSIGLLVANAIFLYVSPYTCYYAILFALPIISIYDTRVFLVISHYFAYSVKGYCFLTVFSSWKWNHIKTVFIRHEYHIAVVVSFILFLTSKSNYCWKFTKFLFLNLLYVIEYFVEIHNVVGWTAIYKFNETALLVGFRYISTYVGRILFAIRFIIGRRGFFFYMVNSYSAVSMFATVEFASFLIRSSICSYELYISYRCGVGFHHLVVRVYIFILIIYLMFYNLLRVYIGGLFCDA